MIETAARIVAIMMKLWLVAALPMLVLGKTFISYAALGDSYAAGDGAGSLKLLPHFDVGCARYDGAYPVKVAQDLVLAFRNLACAGSVTSSVLKTQLPLADDCDVISLQVGGNEVDFFGLLNECVQQWRPLSSCEREIDKARAIMESTAFIDSYDGLLSNARKQLGSDTKLLVLGYAHFFNDKTDQCNHITFSRTNPSNFLTNDMRKMFNSIVSMLNEVIQAVAEAHGALYVDIDQVFEGHRFCEEGVIEPAPNGSWFFNDPDIRSAARGSSRNQHILADTQGFEGFLNLTRTFHPTLEGHRAIADKIIELLGAL